MTDALPTVVPSVNPLKPDSDQPKSGGGLYARVPLAAIFDPRVSDGELRSLAAICAYMNPQNWAWPAQSTVGDAVGKSRTTVNRNVGKLAKLGHFDVHRNRYRDGSVRCSYHVHFTPRHLPKNRGR